MFLYRFTNKPLIMLAGLLFCAPAFSQSSISGNAAIGGTATIGYGSPPPVTPPDLTPPGVAIVQTNSGAGVDPTINTTLDVGSGVNRVLIVGIFGDRVIGPGMGAGDVASVVFNGDAASAVTFTNWNRVHDTEFAGVWFYSLANPDSGSHTLAVEFDSTPSTYHIAAIVLTNAAQTSYIRASSTGMFTDNEVASVVSSSATDLAVDLLILEPDTYGATANGGQTVRILSAAANFSKLAMSTKVGANFSASLGWDTGFGGSQTNAHLLLSVKGAQ